MTTLFIVAGEASGDHHAAGLVEELRSLDAGLRFSGMGGEQMADAGVTLLENLVDRSVMGLRKVVLEMGYLVDLSARFLRALDEEQPDALILVDYPGLNLNLARMARARGIPVIYYICPQVWAWAPWRVRRVAARADLLLVILPFEEPLYRRYHDRTHYVGNPVFDHLAAVEAEPLPTELASSERRILGLFPGSRRQEVEELLPALLRTAEALGRDHELDVIVSCQRERLRPLVDAALEQSALSARVYTDAARDLQRAAHLSLVCSGTATLEQAFFAVPMVVVYPVRKWERWAFRHLSVTPFVALANLFAGQRLVPEILFAEGEEEAILEAARPLVDGPRREQMLVAMRRVKAERLRPGATARAAQRVIEFLTASTPREGSPAL